MGFAKRSMPLKDCDRVHIRDNRASGLRFRMQKLGVSLGNPGYQVFKVMRYAKGDSYVLNSRIFDVTWLMLKVLRDFVILNSHNSPGLEYSIGVIW